MAQDTRPVRMYDADTRLMKRLQGDLFNSIMLKQSNRLKWPTQPEAIHAALKAYFELKGLKKRTAAG